MTFALKSIFGFPSKSFFLSFNKAKKHAKLLNFMQIASNIVSLPPVNFKQ